MTEGAGSSPTAKDDVVLEDTLPSDDEHNDASHPSSTKKPQKRKKKNQSLREMVTYTLHSSVQNSMGLQLSKQIRFSEYFWLTLGTKVCR